MKYNNLAALALLIACLTACADEGPANPDLNSDAADTTDVVDTAYVPDTPDAEDVLDVPDEVETTDTTEDVDDGGDGETDSTPPILTEPPQELRDGCNGVIERSRVLCYAGRYSFRCQNEDVVEWTLCPEGAEVCVDRIDESPSGCLTGTTAPDCSEYGDAEGRVSLCAGELDFDGTGGDPPFGVIFACKDGHAGPPETSAVLCDGSRTLCTQENPTAARCASRPR